MNIIIAKQDFSKIEEEVLIIGVPKNPENVEGWEGFVSSFNPCLSQWIKTDDVKTDYKKIVKIPSFETHKYKRVLFVGLGVNKSLTDARLRNLFAAVGKELGQLKAASVAIWTAPFTNDNLTCADVVFAAAEGIGLGAYAFDGYKTSSNERDVELHTISFLSPSDEQELNAAFEVGKVYAHAVNEARDLVNMPPNLLTAAEMANYARGLAEKHDFEIEVLGKKEMEELGMGAILAVNKGSVEEPRIIVLKYAATDTWEDVIGLVGKGVTYDTGGYSLKPREGMVGMKGDMGGAAAVLGAMDIIGETRPTKNVIAVIAATDNMVSGAAFKPDDVITSLSGKT